MSDVYNKKASTVVLDNLHNVVAEVLTNEIKEQTKEVTTRNEATGEEEVSRGAVDVKLLTVAIKFLKDNDITAEVLESDKIRSLTDNIKEIVNKENKLKEISVEDMIAISERK